MESSTNVAVVLAGTNGEAAALSLNEKVELVRKTRALAHELGRPELPITVGCNGAYTAGCYACLPSRVVRLR